MMENLAVKFTSRSGNTLVGVAHIPENTGPGKSRIGVNLLNPGIKYRVAPNRLNVKIAEYLCRRGFWVLRFDPSGVGDSEGDLPPLKTVPDVWEKIQTGLFVEDTLDSNRYFCELFDLDGIIMMGNCGGAMTALLTGSSDEEVTGLCLIDVPINLRDSTLTFADKIVDGGEKQDWYFSEYLKKMFKPESWYRFLTFKTNYRALVKIFFSKFSTKVKLRKREESVSTEIEDLCNSGKLNALFYESFNIVNKNGLPVLFLMAENDNGTEMFERYFMEALNGERFLDTELKGDVSIKKISNANHVYTDIKHQSQLIGHIAEWAALHFSSGDKF